MPVETANTLLSSLTVFGQIIIIALVILLLYSKSTKTKNPITSFFGKNAILFSFVVALIAMLGSLYYSDIVGYTPCKLCWFQRIFMYPQAFLFGLALIKKDRRIAPYAILLSVPGALIAAFHYREQIAFNPLAPCSAVGYSVSCAEHFVKNFGYITIPMMALTAFLLILAFLFAQKSFLRNQNDEK